MYEGDRNMKCLTRFEEEVSAWPNVSVHPHRFGGKEFRFRKAEIGHVHRDGTVDIPFPRAVRDALLAEGQAEEHRWVPNSGWTTFKVRGEADVGHAIELMRISYLRYALKTASDPHQFLKQERKSLQLSPQFISLLELLAPQRP
ncbi:MAG: luciferase family protein [Candidatus Acidiferrales bacterium]